MILCAFLVNLLFPSNLLKELVMALIGETVASGGPGICEECGMAPTLGVYQSASGYYVGTYCQCGPYSRESGYFAKRERAQKALDSGEFGRPTEFVPGPLEIIYCAPVSDTTRDGDREDLTGGDIAVIEERRGRVLAVLRLMRPFYVALVSCNKAYGGPEEGGWYFDTQEVIEQVPVSSLSSMCSVVRDMMNRYTNVGNYRPDSVLCRGWYEILVRTKPVRREPEARPRYC
jgi:hypothetical protein